MIHLPFSFSFFLFFLLFPGHKKYINIIAVQSEMHKCLWYLNCLSHSIGFSFPTQLSTSLFFSSQSTRGALEERITRSMFPVYPNAALNPNSILKILHSSQNQNKTSLLRKRHNKAHTMVTGTFYCC